MVDLNKIKDIQTAKDQQYNGRPLKDNEKTIFDHANLVSASADVLKEVATLLEEVIKGQEAKSANSTLLTTLETKKNSKPLIYAAINSVENSKYEAAIRKLKSFSSDDEEEQRYLKLIDAKEIEIGVVKKEIAEAEKERDLIKEITKDYIRKDQEIDKKISTLTQFETDLTTGTVFNTERKHLEDIVDRWDEFHKKPEAFFETNFTANEYPQIVMNGKNRKFLSKSRLSDIPLQVFDILRLFDKDKFVAAIKTLGLSNPDETKAIDFYQKQIQNDWFISYKEGIADHSSGTNLQFQNKEGKLLYGGPDKKLVDRPDTIWPINYFDHQKFFEFMNIVFKKSDLNNNPILNATNHPEFASVLNQKHAICFCAISERVGTSENKYFSFGEWIKKNKPELTSELYRVKVDNLDLKQAIKLYYDAFANVQEVSGQGDE